MYPVIQFQNAGVATISEVIPLPMPQPRSSQNGTLAGSWKLVPSQGLIPPSDFQEPLATLQVTETGEYYTWNVLMRVVNSIGFQWSYSTTSGQWTTSPQRSTLMSGKENNLHEMSFMWIELLLLCYLGPPVKMAVEDYLKCKSNTEFFSLFSIY